MAKKIEIDYFCLSPSLPHPAVVGDGLILNLYLCQCLFGDIKILV